MLDGARDALGMQRLRIDWRYTAGDVDTVTRAMALLAAEFTRTGVGRLAYEYRQRFGHIPATPYCEAIKTTLNWFADHPEVKTGLHKT